MLNFLQQLVDGVVFTVTYFVETLLNIPKLLVMMIDSLGLIQSSIQVSPSFLSPIFTLILSVAVIMWVVNLL